MLPAWEHAHPTADNPSFPSAALSKGWRRAEKLIFARSWMTLLSDFHSKKAANNQSITELFRVNILHSYISLRECHLELQVLHQSREKNIIATARCRGEEQASVKAAQTVIPGIKQSQEPEQKTTLAKQSSHCRWEGKKKSILNNPNAFKINLQEVNRNNCSLSLRKCHA